jgi:hypothetical protein
MKKSIERLKQKQKNETTNLEKIYLQYLMPMSTDEWKNIKSLEQPSLLRSVQIKTAYSSGG